MLISEEPPEKIYQKRKYINALGLAMNVLMMTVINTIEAQKIPEAIPGLKFFMILMEFFRKIVMLVIAIRKQKFIKSMSFCEIIQVAKDS